MLTSFPDQLSVRLYYPQDLGVRLTPSIIAIFQFCISSQSNGELSLILSPPPQLSSLAVWIMCYLYCKWQL